MVKESLNFKAEQFFAKNWKFLFWGLVICILVQCWALYNINDRMTHLQEVVYDNNSKVVFTTIDGRAIRVEKEPLKAEYLKQFVISTFVNNFIVSRASLTKGFTQNIMQASEILENYAPLGMIYLSFLGANDDPENKQGYGDLMSYLHWLLSAIAKDKLPEYFNIKDYEVIKYEYVGNAFNLELKIKVAMSSYIISKDAYVNQNGEVQIVASGDFDLQRANDYNPYGLRIKNFSIQIPTKAVKMQ